MKHILVPIDFSKQAVCAAKVAAKIAKRTNADINLLHMLEMPQGVVDAMAGGDHSTPASLLFMKKVHERFNELRARDFFKGLNVSENVQFESTFEGVIDESKKSNADLIVMGSSGASGIKEIIVGSNTEKIVRHSEIPVLVVKEGSSDLEFNTIVFASDYSNESKAKFQNVIDFANKFDAKLHLVYINTPHNFKSTKVVSDKIASFVTSFDIKDFDTYIYNETSIEKGILSYADEVNADLIALNTHGRSGLSSFFNSSVGQDLANHALKPIITFKI